MNVLLTKDVPGLGRAGDVKNVSDGHARNFLIPKHLALPATRSLLAKTQKEEAEKQAKIAREQERMLQLKKKLEGKTFVIKAKVQGKNLFAAIHEDQIAQLISEKTGVVISPTLINLSKPLKSLGLHEVEVRFAPGVAALVRLNIESQ